MIAAVTFNHIPLGRKIHVDNLTIVVVENITHHILIFRALKVHVEYMK